MYKSITTCKICGGTLVLYLHNLFDDRYGYPDLFDIYICTSCKSLITVPGMSMSEIGALYTNYYPRKDISSAAVKERATGWRHVSAFERWLGGEHRIHRDLPKAPKPGIKVLDVGCGDGSSLLELQSLGYEAYGIETDENLKKIKQELNLTIHIGTIEDAPFKEDSFDCVIANQVVEHVVDLQGFFSNIKRFLAPGGTAILSTPNAQSVFRIIYGRDWLHWHIPFHQQILSKKALQSLSEKYGFEVTKTKTVSPSSWTMHEINRMRFEAKPGLKNPFWTSGKPIPTSFFAKVWRKIVFLFMSTLGKIFNLFGYGNCLMIYIKKP